MKWPTLQAHAVFLGLWALLVMGCGGAGPAGDRVVLRMNIDSIGGLLEITRDLAREFEEETGIAVEFIIGPDSSTERLVEYQRFLNARSDHIDIYMIDVVWPGILADHLADLSGVVDAEEFFPAMIRNNTVDGRLVAIPFYADAPLLYYREDLLREAGHDAPPETWEEMEEMARAIMEAQRAAGQSSFHGFVFQGAAYEGLTCNALEWQAAEGGGAILDAEGRPDLDTPGARRAFERARGWVGTIAPRGVLTYQEEESRTIFQQGNAAFLRNWPYVHSLASAEGSPIRGLFGVAPLPAGPEGTASTLGGWGLSVSGYSQHPEEARRFVAFLSSREAQGRRALEGGYLATRMDLYDDDEIAGVIPYFPTMREVFDHAVVRPARQAGPYYNEVSAAYYQAVHAILNGDSGAGEALARAEERLRRILRLDRQE